MADDINKRETRQQIIQMAGPVLLELLLGTLFGMVDMMMLGNYKPSIPVEGIDVAVSGIAAVGITNQFMFIGLSLVQALNTGATSMVARYIGAGRENKIESVVRHVMILTQVLLVVPILLLGLLKPEETMRFIGAQSDAIQIGLRYFKVVVIGFAFQAFNFSVFASLRGAGDTSTPMIINVGVNLLNVVGNMVLIYGLFGFPELGVYGAGVSTSFAQVVATVILVFFLLSKKGVISIDLRKRFKFEKDIIYNLVKIGLPASLEQIALRTGLLIFTRLVSSLGTIAYATHQICISILNLSFTPGQAFGIAASTLTGRSLGEEKPDLAEEYIKICGRIGSVVAFFVAIIFFFFGENLAGLYNNNPAVIAEAKDVLKLVAFIQPFQCSQLILAGGLRGAGDTLWTLLSTFIGILFVRTILAFIFIRKLGLGLQGAWLAVLIDQFIRWILIRIRFNSGKWKYIEIR